MTDQLSTTETIDDVCPSGLCDEQQECTACDGSGADMEGGSDGGCWHCHGAGQVAPEHCYACGGSPYCQCCRTCGLYAGTCSCPQPVTLSSGRVLTLTGGHAGATPHDPEIRYSTEPPVDSTPPRGDTSYFPPL
ncbi:hypothetical protein [Streptomyces synnematoformans]|uniref:Uncharacterized protein n=1 Tax=Streptomyces synnematoformans TaxID=415721 RepID=A0ABN2XCK5_9ACTN